MLAAPRCAQRRDGSESPDSTVTPPAVRAEFATPPPPEARPTPPWWAGPPSTGQPTLAAESGQQAQVPNVLRTDSGALRPKRACRRAPCRQRSPPPVRGHSCRRDTGGKSASEAPRTVCLAATAPDAARHRPRAAAAHPPVDAGRLAAPRHPSNLPHRSRVQGRRATRHPLVTVQPAGAPHSTGTTPPPLPSDASCRTPNGRSLSSGDAHGSSSLQRRRPRPPQRWQPESHMLKRKLVVQANGSVSLSVLSPANRNGAVSVHR